MRISSKIFFSSFFTIFDRLSAADHENLVFCLVKCFFALKNTNYLASAIFGEKRTFYEYAKKNSFILLFLARSDFFLTSHHQVHGNVLLFRHQTYKHINDTTSNRIHYKADASTL